MLRHRRLAAAALAVFAAVASGVGVTYAAFKKTTSTPANVVTARPDWKAPVVGATTIAKSPGYLAGYVKQGGSYHLYANVSDPAGNPAAGVASVVGDPSAITAAQTAVPLTAAGGPWTVEGVTYNYRSAALTADAGVTAGAKSWSIVATDAAVPTANTTSATGLTGTVDVTAPSATGVASANVGGGTQAKMEPGDTITLTTSERLDPESVLSGWAGASTGIVVRVTEGGSANDVVTFWAPGEASQLPLGSIDTGRKDYVSTTMRFGLTGTASTMVQSGGAITITFGTASDATGSSGPPIDMTWTPSASAYDRAGLAMGTAALTENDGDRDF
jgi:hypothetical protein